ncbi:unnamed protein product [Acidithrix sp. C25]|nr:unnamed protein product [Acidithrix sp. C25]
MVLLRSPLRGLLMTSYKGDLAIWSNSSDLEIFDLAIFSTR